MQKKSNSMLIIAASLILIVVAIGVTTLSNRFGSGRGSTEDIRARAGSVGTQLTGTVTNANEAQGTIEAGNVCFVTTKSCLPGAWTVTPPANFAAGSVVVGNRITFTIDSTTLLISSHTMTATQITASR